MTIVQLVYASKTRPDSRPVIEDILVTARARNRQMHVTGYLCFRSEKFLQVLEGSPAAVSLIYSRITNDKRHVDVVILGYQKVLRRSFSAWAMGYVANFGHWQDLLLRYSADNEFDPYEMDHRSAIEFLEEVASGAAALDTDRRSPAAS